MQQREDGATSVELILSSEVRLVDLVHSTSERMAEVAGFDPDEALNVGLAVREAVINAIVHGNRKDPKRSVHVRFEADGSELRIRVRDEGEGFDPDATPDPTEDPNLLRTSGRGLLLVRAFVDGVEFRRRDPGMEITLTKTIPGADDA
jgi:serine/threonine-protein kinase RsbW